MFRFKTTLQFKFLSAITCLVVPLLGIIFLWQGVTEERQAWSQVITQARVLTQQIILTRQWVSDSEGIYIRRDTPGAKTGASFYTDLLPSDRGVLQRFTPSMVTKQLSIYSNSQNLYRFRLAGLAPMNPENKPEQFELEAIQHFARGESNEYYGLAGQKGREIFQYSVPLYVDETCLSCHKDYTSGTISGCLSIFLPAHHILDALRQGKMQLFTSALALIVLTVLTLYYLVRRLVVTPLNKLEYAAEKISNGDFSSQISIDSNDEMDRLGQALQSMSAKLEESREQLEEKIRNATRDLAQANEELKTVDRLKTEFLATMSHELRSPLTSIRGSLDYLRRIETVSDRQEYLHIMDKNLRRLVHLVTDIFDITRIEAKKEEWRFADNDLAELIAEVTQIMAPQAEAANVRLEFHATEAVRCAVDLERIEQVLVNLTDNAIKYSPPNGTVFFELQRKPKTVQVCVRDQGPGIAPQDRLTIFEKFHTAPSSGRHGKPGGTGLGLAICAQIVKAHDGRIWMEDNPAGGSIFCFTLPCPTAVEEEARPQKDRQ